MRGRGAWRKAIDIIESLRPRRIIAGHKNKDLDDDATRQIAETQLHFYLDDVFPQIFGKPLFGR